MDLASAILSIPSRATTTCNIGLGILTLPMQFHSALCILLSAFYIFTFTLHFALRSPVLHLGISGIQLSHLLHPLQGYNRFLVLDHQLGLWGVTHPLCLQPYLKESFSNFGPGVPP